MICPADVLTDGPKLCSHTKDPHEILSRIRLNARRGKLCFLSCVTVINCNSFFSHHSGGNQQRFHYFSCSSPNLQTVALLAYFISHLQSKSTGHSPFWVINNVYSKAKMTVLFNTASFLLDSCSQVFHNITALLTESPLVLQTSVRNSL